MDDTRMFRTATVPVILCCALSASLLAVEKPVAPPPPTPIPEREPEAPAPKDFPRGDALESVSALMQALQGRDEKLVLIDARGEKAYSEGHLPQARNIQ